jgi:hypothetical protein
MSIITGRGLGKKLVDAGIVPANTIRIIIDIDVNSAVKLYYEVFGDERLLEIDWTDVKPVIFDKNSLTPEFTLLEEI